MWSSSDRTAGHVVPSSTKFHNWLLSLSVVREAVKFYSQRAWVGRKGPYSLGWERPSSWMLSSIDSTGLFI